MIYHLTPRHTTAKNYEVKAKIERDLENAIVIGKDIKVEIKDYDFRSLNALRAYFVLIQVIVAWHKQYCLDHGGKPYGIREWRYYFEDQAGLVDEIDLMPMWQLKYKSKIKEGWYFEENEYELEAVILVKTEYNFLKESEQEKANWNDYHIILGFRYQKQPRSLSNKGDVTKIEMERLLTTVLQFGAENGIEDCKIEDRELKRMLEAYE